MAKAIMEAAKVEQNKVRIVITEEPAPFKIMTEKEVAAMLRISIQTMRHIREHGTIHHKRPIPYHMLGCGERQGLVYFADEVNEWVKELNTYTGAARADIGKSNTDLA